MATSTTLSKKTEAPPRERILNAACELFYSRGIRAVSVDEIAAAADTNKMTLYRHFESKDLLVAEYLRSWIAFAMARDEEAIRPYAGDPYKQLKALVDRYGNDLCKEDFRGCPVANAVVEFPDKDHPARIVAETAKVEHRQRMVQLCSDAGYLEPERIADELFLLFEGACANVQSQGSRGPCGRFAKMAHALIDSHPRRTAVH